MSIKSKNTMFLRFFWWRFFYDFVWRVLLVTNKTTIFLRFLTLDVLILFIRFLDTKYTYIYICIYIYIYIYIISARNVWKPLTLKNVFFYFGSHFRHNFGKNVQRIFGHFRYLEIFGDSRAAQPNPGRSESRFSNISELSVLGRVPGSLRGSIF